MLTGGASQLAGLDSLAAEILGGQVRLARPFRLRSLPQAASGAGFSSSVGLCILANRPQNEAWHREVTATLNERKEGLSFENKVVDLDDIDRAISNTPNAEIISVDPGTHRARAIPISDADPDFLRDARDRMRDTLKMFGTFDDHDNQYVRLKPEIDTLERGLKLYSCRPLRLHDIALQVIRRVDHKEKLGECPDATKDAIVADFKLELSCAAQDLRQQDSKVREVVQARANEKFQDIDIESLAALPDLADVVSQPAEAELAEDLRNDASIAADRAADPTSRANALYRFASRTFRIVAIALKSARGILKESASIWRDVALAVSAYPAIAEVLRFLLALF